VKTAGKWCTDAIIIKTLIVTDYRNQTALKTWIGVSIDGWLFSQPFTVNSCQISLPILHSFIYAERTISKHATEYSKNQLENKAPHCTHRSNREQTEKYKKRLENVAITVALPRAASRCVRTRSHFFTLARWLALSRTQQNLRTLSSTCSHSPEILCTRLFSLVHLLAHTLWNSLSFACHPLVHTRSNLHTFSQTCSPCAAKPFSFRCLLHAIPQVNPFAT